MKDTYTLVMDRIIAELESGITYTSLTRVLRVSRANATISTLLPDGAVYVKTKTSALRRWLEKWN